MLLLELAVQGVRGFSPAARAALQPGYLVLRSPTEFPAPVSKLLTTLLYNEGRGDDGGLKAPNASVSRVGLSIQARDDVWRLMRELGGAAQLHKMNRQSKVFELVTQDAAEMGQVLLGDIGLPDKSTYDNLFMFTAAQLPTRKPKEKKPPPGFQSSPSGFRSSPSGFQSSSSALFPAPKEADSVENIADTKVKIGELEAELQGAQHIAETQFKMDGLQGDIFKLETQLKAYEDLRSRVDAARAEMSSAPTPESLGLPPDIVERVSRSGAEKKRRDDALARLNTDREAAGAQDKLVVRSVFRDSRFLGALGAAAGALLLSMYMHEGSGRFFSLLAIPAFTFAALLALRYVEELQYAAREGAKANVFDQREKKINDEFEMYNSIIEMAFDKTGAATADEFFTAMSRREALVPELQNLELEFADFTSDPETERWPTKLHGMRQEFERLNTEIGGAGGSGYARDPREIERDLARLKEVVRKAEAPPPPKAEETAIIASAPVIPDNVDDPMPALLARGAAMFGVDIPTLWTVLHDRTLQYMTALTDRRYSGIDVDAEGGASAETQGRRLTVPEMPGRDVDILYLSTRMTLVEKFSAQQKLPMVLEDAFASVIEASKQQLFWRMLKHMGTLTQVLHVTGVGQQVTTADVTIAL